MCFTFHRSTRSTSVTPYLFCFDWGLVHTVKRLGVKTPLHFESFTLLVLLGKSKQQLKLPQNHIDMCLVLAEHRRLRYGLALLGCLPRRASKVNSTDTLSLGSKGTVSSKIC